MLDVPSMEGLGRCWCGKNTGTAQNRSTSEALKLAVRFDTSKYTNFQLMQVDELWCLDACLPSNFDKSW